MNSHADGTAIGYVTGELGLRVHEASG
jgi:hypothetical protein